MSGSRAVSTFRFGTKTRQCLVLASALLALPVIAAPMASADTKKFAAKDGSTTIRKITYKPKRMVPIMAVLRMPFAFKAGVPTRAELTLKFWNAPITVGTDKGNRRTRTFRLYNKAFVRPGVSYKAESCRPPAGAPDFNMYDGLCLPGTYQSPDPFAHGSGGMPETDEPWFSASADIAQPNYDVTFSKQGLKSKWLRKNQSVRYKIWVTFPRCLPLDTTPWVRDYKRPKGFNWPCEPGSMTIGTTYKLKGKNGWKGSGDTGFWADSSLYIHPPTQ